MKFNINLKSPELHKQKAGSSFYVVPRDYKLLNCFRYIEDDGQKEISHSAKDKMVPPKEQNQGLTKELLHCRAEGPHNTCPTGFDHCFEQVVDM